MHHLQRSYLGPEWGSELLHHSCLYLELSSKGDEEYDETEDHLKALQSVGQIIGEVLKQLGDTPSERQLAKTVAEIGVDADGVVLAEDFVREQSARSPTQSIATAIFFVQSLGLILKDADFFGILGALNLDLEAATGQVRALPGIDAFK